MCVATYQRPAGLTRLLRALQRQELDGDAALELIVVDNDPAGSACELCETLGRESRWPVTCFAESRRGIPLARNAAVRRALESGAELLAFVDDDEVPSESWVRELLLALTRHGADVVTGPVLPRFESEPPRWILAGRFFDPPEYPTGTPLDRAYSGNVLLRTEVFSRVGGLFDERLRVMGEDTDFFLRAAAAGCKIVWAEAAIVDEWIPPDRTRLSWLVRRAHRTGVVWGQIPLARARHRRVALLGLVKGLLWLPWSWLGGRAAAVKALRLIAIGAGYLKGRARALPGAPPHS